MSLIIFFMKIFSLISSFLGMPGIFALVLIPGTCFFIACIEVYFPFLKPFNDHVRFLVKGFFWGVRFVFFGILTVISYILSPLWRFIKWLWSCIFGSKDIPSPKKPVSGPDLGGGPGDDPDDSDLPPPPKFPKRVEDIISKHYSSTSSSSSSSSSEEIVNNSNSPSVTVDQIVSNQQPTEISIAPSVSIISEPSPIIRSETISTEIEITSENQPIASPLISNNIEATVSENSTVVSQENINIDSSISSTVSSAPEEEPLVVVSDSQPPLDPDSGGEKVNFDIEIEKPQEVCLAPSTPTETVTEVSSTPSVTNAISSNENQLNSDFLVAEQEQYREINNAEAQKKKEKDLINYIKEIDPSTKISIKTRVGILEQIKLQEEYLDLSKKHRDLTREIEKEKDLVKKEALQEEISQLINLLKEKSGFLVENRTQLEELKEELKEVFDLFRETQQPNMNYQELKKLIDSINDSFWLPVTDSDFEKVFADRQREYKKQITSFLSNQRAEKIEIESQQCPLTDEFLELVDASFSGNLQNVTKLSSNYSHYFKLISDSNILSEQKKSILLKILQIEYFEKIRQLHSAFIHDEENQLKIVQLYPNSIEDQDKAMIIWRKKYHDALNKLLVEWKVMQYLENENESYWFKLTKIFENYYENFKEYLKRWTTFKQEERKMTARFDSMNQTMQNWLHSLDSRKKLIKTPEQKKMWEKEFSEFTKATKDCNEIQQMEKLYFHNKEKEVHCFLMEINKKYKKFGILLIFIPSSIKYFKLEFSWNNLLLFITVLTLILTFYRYFNGEALGAAYLPIIKEVLQGIKEWIKTKWC